MPTREARRPQVNEDLVFQRRDWLVQRVAWGLLALIVVAGLAGLFGSGPLSTVKARSGTDLEVEYERFIRHGAPSELQVKIDIGVAKQVRVAISRQYLSALNLQQVIPTPMRVQSAGHSLVYIFETPSGRGPMEATFVIQPDKLGTHQAQISVETGSSVSIRQFTYP